MSELVNISKPGEPVLKILRSTLDEHVKLGWAETDKEPAKPKKEKSEEKPDQPAE